ncbi:MAG: hypothetical protein V1649_04720 [Patescibacteria group bacterium]
MKISSRSLLSNKSIEDWQHSQEEVNYLMKLFKSAITDDLAREALC